MGEILAVGSPGEGRDNGGTYLHRSYDEYLRDNLFM